MSIPITGFRLQIFSVVCSEIAIHNCKTLRKVFPLPKGRCQLEKGIKKKE